MFVFLISPSHAQQSLSLGNTLDYETGRAIFEKIWVSSPASTTASDGLGPLYNARSCQQCHEGGGRGLVKNSLVIHINDEYYGQQIQTHAITGLPAEAQINISHSERTITFPDGEQVVLKVPEYSFSDSIELSNFSPRIAPSLKGLGVIEMIPSSLIVELEDENDSNNDGISGRVNWMSFGLDKESRLGRFGWKAGSVTLGQQNAKALNLDIGISSSLYPDPYGDCTNLQQVCLSRENGNSPRQDNLEASDLMVETLLFFTRNIPAPIRSKNQSLEVQSSGEALFNTVGCNACHHPQFEVSGASIKPYSDFLLHDMGAALADNFIEGQASGNEWRTAPLWGLGGLEEAEYLHDGRASTLQEAILWHGGEAERAIDRYKSMPKAARDGLIRFLNSL